MSLSICYNTRMKRLYCPKCRTVSAIRYGKIKPVGSKEPVQRKLCKKCHKISYDSYRHPFFKGMHVNPEEFHEAMDNYSMDYSASDIAMNMKIRPNTFGSWVTRVRKNKAAYSNYIKAEQRHTYITAKKFLKRFTLLNIKERTKNLKQYRPQPLLEQPSCAEPA